MDFKDGYPLTCFVHSESFDETYTAYIQKNGTGFLGHIPDFPEVECPGDTIESVKAQLHDALDQALNEIEDAWEKQFEADVKAGRLEPLVQKAKKDYKAGKYTRIV